MNSWDSQSLGRHKATLRTTKHRVVGGMSQVLLVAYGSLTIIAGFSVYQIVAKGSIVVPPEPYDGLHAAYNYLDALGFSFAAASVIFLAFVILFTYTVSEVSRSIHGHQVGDAAIPFALVAFPLNILFGTAYGWTMYDVIYEESSALVPLLPPTVIFVPSIHWSMWFFFVILFHVLTGAQIALLGASLILNSKHFPTSKLWKTAGIIYLVSAALYFSVVLDFFGAIAAVAAGIFGLACFVKGGIK